MNRALPGPMVDLVRDGVRPAQLRTDGGKAVRRALISTAASARLHGWDQWEWSALLAQPGSRLGEQARSKDGKRTRTPEAHAEYLDSAWDRATAWLNEQRPLDAEQMKHRAHERAAAAVAVCEDPEVDLAEPDRAVLAFAAGEVQRRGFDRVALPRRAVVEATGHGERTVRTSFTRLERAGLLVLEVRGQSAKEDSAYRRAGLYRLGTVEELHAYRCRGTRPMGPPVQTYGTPQPQPRGTPAPTYGTPPAKPAPQETTVITLVITAAPEALARALASLQADEGVRVEQPEQHEHVDNVLPFRSSAAP